MESPWACAFSRTVRWSRRMPRQFQKPIDLYKHQIARFAHVARTIREMHREISEAGGQDGQELTSGTTSTAQLRAMGHPFGRGTGASNGRYRPGLKRGRLRSLPINRQTGGLQRRLQLRRGRGGIQTFELTPGVHPGNWVLNPDGTRKMVGRGFWLEIKKRWRARNKALLDAARQRQRSF